jgi:hypothetical protein
MCLFLATVMVSLQILGLLNAGQQPYLMSCGIHREKQIMPEGMYAWGQTQGG